MKDVRRSRTSGLHVEDIHVSSGREVVLQQNLHEFGAGCLTAKQLALNLQVRTGPLQVGIGGLGPGLHLHGCVQRSWFSPKQDNDPNEFRNENDHNSCCSF